jgi:EmrB/QacA subfamily drug resistance transporter
VQGIGGALLTPQTMAIITTIFPKERRGAAFGVWGAVAGVAAVAGPTLGGLLVTDASWRWIFYVNVPIGVAAFILALIVVPDLRPGRRHRLDTPGVALISASIFLITFGLIEGERYHWGDVWGPISITEMIVAGVVLLVVFFFVQRAERGEPLVPLIILRNRNFAVMNGVGMALQFGMLGMFLPMTIYLQSVLHLSALDAGLTIAPMSLVALFLAPLAGRLSDAVGGKYILLSGLLLFALGMLLLLWQSRVGAARWDFLPGFLVCGVGMGGIFAPMTTVAMHDIEPRLAGAAAGVFNTTRQLGSVIGSAAVGALLQNRIAAGLHAQAADRVGELPAQFRTAFIDAFDHAASAGLQVGTGQTGAAVSLPSGVPASVASHVTQIATEVFEHGFVDGMRPTVLLPIGVLIVAGAGCLLIREHRRSEDAPEGPAAEAAEVAA